MLKSANLHFSGFHHPPYRSKFNSFFSDILKDPDLQDIVEKLNKDDQAAITELVYGDLDLHHIFASKQNNSSATIADRELVPILYGNPTNLQETLHIASKNPNGTKNDISEALVGYVLNPEYGHFNIRLPTTKSLKNILYLMSQGKKEIVLFRFQGEH